MKTKIVNRCFGVLLLLSLLTACEEDGERLYLSGLEENTLVATESAVVLSQENSLQIVLSLTWSKSTLAVSNPDVSAPDVLTATIQIAAQNDFTSQTVEFSEKNLSRAYTGAELNTIAKNLGLEANLSAPLFFRIKSSIGVNMEPVYSNVATVNVTPYSIDMSTGFILFVVDGEKVESGLILVSPESNGVYTGFMGASGWQNFFLREGDGTIWGNAPVTGSAFLLSSEEPWNFWFPGQSGCYYVDVNTNTKEWSALWLPTLTVSGSLTGEMTFDRTNVKWTFVFNAASASALKIKLNSSGQLYNAKTGDAASENKALAFAQEGERLILAAQAGEITVNVAAAGEYTLEIDLSNPNAWTCQVVSGSTAPPVEVSPYVYLPGIDDGITGGDWNFDRYLSLYNEDNLTYVGVVNVHSLWGYNINPKKGVWEDKYVYESGDAYGGTLVFRGDTDIPAPTPGLYLIETSLKALTYNLTHIGNQIYAVGLNDSWTFDVPLTATAIPGVFSGSITINHASEWGFHIDPDDSWSHKFGGSDGKLYYQGSNITDDAALAPGTYQMTVDLVNMTYEIK